MTPKEEALDPTTPPERLAKLLLSHLKLVLANPILPLLFIEEPLWLERYLWPQNRVTLLNQAALPTYLVAALAQSPDEWVQKTARLHVALEALPVNWEARVADDILATVEEMFLHQISLMEHFGLLPAWLGAAWPSVGTLDPLWQEIEARRTAALGSESALCERLTTTAEQLGEILEGHCAGTVDRAVLDRLTDHPNLTLAQAQLLQERFGLVVPRLLSAPALLEAMHQKTVRKRAVLGRSDVPLVLKWDALFESGYLLGDDFARACRLCAVERSGLLKKAVTSRQWVTRFMVAIHERATKAYLAVLHDDANCYVRAAARARREGGGAWKFPAS